VYFVGTALYTYLYMTVGSYTIGSLKLCTPAVVAINQQCYSGQVQVNGSLTLKQLRWIYILTVGTSMTHKLDFLSEFNCYKKE
jgi:hypothetical protein